MSSPYVVAETSTRRVLETPQSTSKPKRHQSMHHLSSPHSTATNPKQHNNHNNNISRSMNQHASGTSSQTEHMSNSNVKAQIHNGLTYLPTIVARDIEARTKAGKTPIRALGEFGHEEFNGACAFFDISGFSKLASRLGKREREEEKKRRNTDSGNKPSVSLQSLKHVRGNSLLGKTSSIGAKGLLLSHAETIAKQHEASLKLLPRILSERRGMGAETLA